MKKMLLLLMFLVLLAGCGGVLPHEKGLVGNWKHLNWFGDGFAFHIHKDGTYERNGVDVDGVTEVPWQRGTWTVNGNLVDFDDPRDSSFCDVDKTWSLSYDRGTLTFGNPDTGCSTDMTRM